MLQRMTVVCGLAGVLALGIAGQAFGETSVSRSGNTITITGGDEVNYVEMPTVSSPGPLRIHDPGGLSYDPGSCTDLGDSTVQCGDLGAGLVANVSLGGGDDTFRPEYIINTAPRLIVDLGPGNDTSWGSTAADDLKGGPGDDTIIGMDGNDTIDGGEGRDRLTGSSGDDTITGGPGVDSMFGDGEYSGLDFGNDTLLARDGEIDALSCSFGADSAVADGNDTFDVLGDCESRDIPAAAAPVPGPAPGAGGTTPVAVALTVAFPAPAAVKLGKLLGGSALSARLTFSAACTMTSSLVVRKAEAKRLKIGTKDTTIARAVNTVPKAGTYPVSLKLKSSYRKKLKKAKSVTAYLVASCTDLSGAKSSSQRKLVLKR